MKQKVITFTKVVQFDADINFEMDENELTKLVGQGWAVRQVSSQVYFKPKGKEMGYQYILYTLLLESAEHPDGAL
jgi:hypothetical protein